MLMTPEELIGPQDNMVPDGRRQMNRMQQKLVKVRGGTKRERRMLWGAVVLFVLANILIIVLIGVHTAYERALRNTVSYCDKEECIRSGADLVQSLDRSVDPCVDFYRFACGRWGRHHPPPERRATSSWFSERGRSLDRRVTEVLTEDEVEGEPSSLKLMRNLYSSCIDTSATEEAGLAPLAEALSGAGLALRPPSLPGGEPKLSLGAALAKAQRLLSLDVMLELSFTHDRNHSINVLRVSPAATILLSTHVTGPPWRQRGELRRDAGRGSGRSPWRGDRLVPAPEEDVLAAAAPMPSGADVLKAELAFMARVTQHLANAQLKPDEPELPFKNATQLALKLLLFEVALRNFTTRRRPKTINATWYDFQQILNESYGKANTSKDVTKEEVLDLEDYVTTLSEGLNNTMDYYNDVIFLVDVPYFRRMGRLLVEEGNEAAQRYVWWRMVYALLPYTTAKLRGYERTFHERLAGPHLPRSPRVQTCTSFVKGSMPTAVTYSMSRKYPLDDVVAMVKEILYDIRQSFRGLVRKADWMDRDTQDSTIDKMVAVTSFIGYPEWLNESGALDRRYSGLQLEPKKYLMNVVNLKSFSVRHLMESLGVNDSITPPDLWESIDPIQVNAFYTQVMNAIVIPAGILQRPFFRKAHGALSYGAIGAILGHELTHGFDSEGRKYNKYGRRESWWSNKSVSEYNERAQCFVRQYNRYRMPGRNKVDGALTLAENIADNGGVHEALHAYRSFLQRHGNESALPGLAEFSPEQLFFIGFANLWCNTASPAYDRASVKDRHSPARVRVLGSLSNSPEFAQAWRCPVNSAMNPRDKCILW